MQIFQFTPLREGRRTEINHIGLTCDFNSRPSARGDHDGGYDAYEVYISIHAPPRGATTNTRFSMCSAYHFNSRPSARGDGNSACASAFERAISIHAPPRGATARRCCLCGAYLISIHAPPRGATDYGIRVGGAFSFQFTPLREGRRQKICNFCKSFVQPLQISMA